MCALLRGTFTGTPIWLPGRVGNRLDHRLPKCGAFAVAVAAQQLCLARKVLAQGDDTGLFEREGRILSRGPNLAGQA